MPPRIGILEETASRRHQFVLGRRGVGKSTLLRKIESSEQEANRAVVFVDIETLRNRPYPDVLIGMLIELLGGLRDRLAPEDWYRLNQHIARLKVRRRLATLTATLRRLLAQPEVAQRTVRGCSPVHQASQCAEVWVGAGGGKTSRQASRRAKVAAARRPPRVPNS